MKSYLIVALTGLLLAGCNSINVQNFDLTEVAGITRQAMSLKEPDTKEENAIGRESAGMLLGATSADPLFPNDHAQRYVNLVGAYVASFSSRRDLKWHFAITNDPEVNAFAAPGGYILITAGLLAQLESEAELAAVLAHEIAHVDEKHHLKALQINKKMNLASDTAMLIYTSRENEPELDPEIAEKLLDVTRTLYSKGLDKEDEFNADARAVDLLIASGYSPYALVDVLQRLDAQSERDSRLALLLSTHPAPRARLENIDNIMPAAGWAEGQNLKGRFYQNLR